jgi:REP element-mobilizing transposase RayT
MPEHIHFLLEGTSHGSDLKKFISTYKQYTAFHYKKSVTQDSSPAKSQETKLWQPSYYDRVLRNEDGTLATARYIFENPVRKNLVTHYREYQFMGSFKMDIEDFF